MANSSPQYNEGSVRRSARKRRTPGEWWKEFSKEEENAVAPTAHSQQDISLGRKVRASPSSTPPDGSRSKLSQEPHLPPGATREGDNGPCVDSSYKQGLFQNNSSNIAGKARNKPDAEVAAPGTGKETPSRNQPHEWDVDVDKFDLEQQHQPPSPNQHHGSPPQVGTKSNPLTSHPSAPNSCGRLVNQPSPSTGELASFSDKSSLTTTNPGSFPASLQTNIDEVEPSRRQSGHQRDTSGLGIDQETRYDKEMGYERDQSDHITPLHTGRSRKRMDENDGLEAYEQQQRFASAQILTARENEKSELQERTPQPSKRLFSAGPNDEFGRRHRGFSNLRAPRKSRSKPDSPSYSFSLRSRQESPDFLGSVQKLSRNQQLSGEQKRNKSRHMQQKALVAKRSTLMYNSIGAYAGTVKVAISISLNKTTMGEVALLPRSATGPRRASAGDEFYIVKQGYVECDIGFVSVTLFAGDHLGIPEGQSFEMRNPSASKSELFFFSPRSLLN